MVLEKYKRNGEDKQRKNNKLDNNIDIHNNNHYTRTCLVQSWKRTTSDIQHESL